MINKSIVNQNSNTCNCGYVLKSQALELSWGDGSSVYLSWTSGRTSCSQDSHEVELCHQLGEKLGLKDREQVHLCFTRSILILSSGTFRKLPNV